MFDAMAFGLLPAAALLSTSAFASGFKMPLRDSSTSFAWTPPAKTHHASSSSTYLSNRTAPQDDTIFNVRSVPHETNLDNRSVFEVITGHPSRIDVIVTIRGPDNDGAEHRLACVSVKHAADELGMNQARLNDLKNGANGVRSIAVTRPPRFAGWRAVRVEVDPGKLAYKALLEVDKKARAAVARA